MIYLTLKISRMISRLSYVYIIIVCIYIYIYHVGDWMGQHWDLKNVTLDHCSFKVQTIDSHSSSMCKKQVFLYVYIVTYMICIHTLYVYIHYMYTYIIIYIYIPYIYIHVYMYTYIYICTLPQTPKLANRNVERQHDNSIMWTNINVVAL